MHVAGPARVSKWAFKAGASSWDLDIEELRGLITPQTKMVVVNFPHNPTGFLPTARFQESLALLAEEHGISWSTLSRA